MALLGACSATKFVPEGEYMLESVSVKSTDKSLDATSLKGYIRHTAVRMVSWVRHCDI